MSERTLWFAHVETWSQLDLVASDTKRSNGRPIIYDRQAQNNFDLTLEYFSNTDSYYQASGLLFHAGKIIVVTVGLPARGKTHISRALERYLRWMGVKTQVISLGDYRRKVLGGAHNLPKDYFTLGPSALSVTPSFDIDTLRRRKKSWNWSASAQRKTWMRGSHLGFLWERRASRHLRCQ